MSSRIAESPVGQVLSETAQQVCCQSTPCKVGSIALGVLLIGVASVMFFSQINVIVTYTTVGCGGALILGSALISLIDLIRANTLLEKMHAEAPHDPVSKA